MATETSSARAVADVEAAVGRSFDFIYRYHDVNDVVPDAAERVALEQGKLLHISIAARDFSHPQRGSVTWKEVARGDFDPGLRRQAKGLAAVDRPVFVTFEQEADQSRKVADLGAPADFVAAWRHLHDLYQDEGADNVVWVWVMTGVESNLDTAASMWPGNDDVDWISWNVYNQSGCRNRDIDPNLYESFEEQFLVFWKFIHQRGAELGVDSSKPMMISEAGSAQYSQAPMLTARWYREIPDVLERYRQVRAVTLWDSVDGGCDYRFQRVPPVLDAVRSVGLDPFVNTHPSLPGTATAP